MTRAWHCDPVLSIEDELRLRREAMAWLAPRTNDGTDAISRAELAEFVFDGERLPLIDAGRGIRKPAKCQAALTIMTVHTPEGRERPYEDVRGADSLPRYKMRADSRGSAENRAVMRAMELGMPLIWLWGVAPGYFLPISPVYVAGVEADRDQFVLAYDATQQVPIPDSPLEEVIRRYRDQMTQQRVHQPVFRAMVLRAYANHCAVCALKYPRLLDAAHIIGDREEHGIAAVRNGLALCKVHHAAYDANILGISPDYRVAIREDILDDVDGPLFEHGIKGLHGGQLMALPAAKRDKPDVELLGWRFEQFLSA